ncbi:DIP1984 family protein [Planktothrix sp. FACHB-1365]|uniref:DIP1984 family protein n=1 Tax=Planktothrix sp. FACHB-1365 TaxID=2692855 RepID=UPI00168A190C|nr:DIP1984 family protein [Planktothrix sp. FACHB-1365]MBD2485166.1 DIP1984 family protein [Planktothrix sp. FACHB-1365]
MKLAEALILRGDSQKKIAQLRQRLSRVAKVQEGEQPAENPGDLLAELEAVTAELVTLIKQINRTNSTTAFQAGTLADALAERDVLILKRNVYDNLVQEAAIRQDRYSRSEVRFVSTIDIAAIQRQVDNLSRDYRELDAQIQAINWQTDLQEI